MNCETGRMYYGDEIQAAIERAEPITEISAEEELRCRMAALGELQKQRGRPFRRDPVTGMKLRVPEEP